jgi:hypothetical protein
MYRSSSESSQGTTGGETSYDFASKERRCAVSKEVQGLSRLASQSA